MNLFVFLAIWALLWYIPLPPRKFRLTSVWRFVSLLIGLLIFLIIALLQTPLSVFIYLLFLTRLFLAIIECLSIEPMKIGELKQYVSAGTHGPVKVSFKFPRKTIALLLIGIFLLSTGTLIVYGQIQQVTNAAYFNSFIQPADGLPFSSTIPDDMVRLVTRELAVSIARRHMSEFGSNTQILGCHITEASDGSLVWVAAVGSTNVIAENYIKGFIIVDATDPTVPPTILRNEFDVGEGLWWDHNVPFRNYMADMARTYGVAYYTWDSTIGSLMYVVTRYNVGFDLIMRYEPPLVYDAQGNLQYAPAAVQAIPEWITQVYDENWLEAMITEMGNFRRTSGFDYWAGGFLWLIPPSRDRFEITEDTRYIVDPETGDVVALVCVNPVGNQRTLSGVFKATREGILFYDFSRENYISGMTAEDLVEGRLPKPATGNYYAMMPLLYTVEISAGNYRLAWYVPIYWYELSGEADETVYLAGFAIVDALDTSKIALTIGEQGMKSEQLVQRTRLDFIKLFGAAAAYLELDATVLGKYDYVEDGVTHIALHLDNTTYPWVEATPKTLAPDQWNELLATEPADRVKLQLEKRGDKWIITLFKNVG
ncbi:MAG: hypothetical protein NWF09_05660 [Candidatus Bathyarchaeota archaeon]|nr:hypothetical protein [Candidatus Bathyarchaeota archaeon]